MRRFVCDTCKKGKKAHEYIGETSRLLSQKIREHASSISGNKLVSIHTIENGHSFEFNRRRILDCEMNRTKSEIKVYIKKYR